MVHNIESKMSKSIHIILIKKIGGYNKNLRER